MMETPAPTPSRYYTLLHQQREAQLLLAVLRLDLFTHLDHWTSAAELTASAGFPEDQLGMVLEALAAAGFIQEEGGRYRNTAEAAEYLSRNSRHCIRDALLFRSQMTTLEHMDQLVVRGREPAASEMPYDFAGLAEAVVPEMYATGRVEAFLREMEKSFPDRAEPLQVLDVGGGSGLLAIEFVLRYPNSEAVVFEHTGVAGTTRRIIGQYGAQERIKVQAGDFNRDRFEGKYNLVVASGVLDFAGEFLPDLLGRMRAALAPGGFLLVIGQFSQRESRDSAAVLAWLSGRLAGLSAGPDAGGTGAGLPYRRSGACPAAAQRTVQRIFVYSQEG
jgi:methylase of polypeptide subunit release factors